MTNIRAARTSLRTGVALVLLATLGLLNSQQSAQANQLTIVKPSLTLNARTGNQIWSRTAVAGNAAGQVDGVSVPWVFSLTYSQNAYVPNTYDMKATAPTVANAAQVAWLVQQYGTETIGNAKFAAVLQAAIWKVINGDNFHLSYFNGVTIAQNVAMMASYALVLASAIGNSASVGSVTWLSPVSAGGSPVGAFVTVGSLPSAPPAIATPEPTTLLIAGVGVVAMMLIHRRGKFRLDRETGEDVNSPALASA